MGQGMELEKHRIPARAGSTVAHPARCHAFWRRPAATLVAGQPDADIRCALAQAAKPRGDQPLRSLNNGGGVAGWRGALLADELLAHHRGRRGTMVWNTRSMGAAARAQEHSENK
jgi:hypothetical protein